MKEKQKMNPNEIKKALELCINRTVSCVGCPFEKDNFCGRKILQGSLAYINDLEDKVERLKKNKNHIIHIDISEQYQKECEYEIKIALLYTCNNFNL